MSLTGDNPSDSSSSSSQLLYYAVAQGDNDQVTALLTEGYADINARNATGDTVLHFSVQKGLVSMTELLLSFGADSNVHENAKCSGRTPLHLAAKLGHTKLCHLLIDNSAKVNDVDSQGFTALHWAAKEGHLETVEALISRGAEGDAKDYQGKTPQYWAKEYGHHKIVKILPEFKYDVWNTMKEKEVVFKGDAAEEGASGDPKKKGKGKGGKKKK